MCVCVIAFLASLVGAIGGKLFTEAELYNAAMTPRPDGDVDFSRSSFWLADGSIGHTNDRMAITPFQRAQWFRRPGDPSGSWLLQTYPAGTRFRADPLVGLRRFRFELSAERQSPPAARAEYSYFTARLPLWPFVPAFGYLPARAAIAWCRGRRRYASGHCGGCGYDLRFSPVRCPECGRGVGAAAAAAQ